MSASFSHLEPPSYVWPTLNDSLQRVNRAEHLAEVGWDTHQVSRYGTSAKANIASCWITHYLLEIANKFNEA